MENLEAVRSWYAEELRYAGGVSSAAVVRAFAAVPRERFLGPGPWQVCTGPPHDKYWSTGSADPRCVYHNVVIGLLPEKSLNNGQPSLWATLFDQLDLAPGKRVLHLGCGTGYFSAVLAEIVGPGGHVTAVDREEGLAAHAADALAAWPQATVLAGDGATYKPDGVDVIIASAGVTHPLPQWLDALPPGGQLLLPLTGQQGWGQTLLVTRHAEAAGFAARFAGFVGIYHFEGARDPEAAEQVDVAMRRGDFGTVKSLRRDPHNEDESCWLHGAGWCLSRIELQA
jgi:protein-L-isoaspartate(D-aspartate) O-methyltransferase